MTITNHYNLPAALVAAIVNDSYNKGASDYSVTGLLKPARIVALEHLHAKELTEDASDRIWSLVGQLGHLVLERAGKTNIVEQRLYASRVYKDGSIRISGQLDVEDASKITDWKFTSAWSIKNGAKEEWIQQTNLQAWLCAENGIKIESIQIVAILRDWSILEAKRDPAYPQQQVKVFQIPLWPMVTTLAFLDGRINAMESAKEQLPECTSSERWRKPEVWAVMKEGRERAVKLYYKPEPAEDHATREKKLFVQHRPGINVRCENYCIVSEHCQQFKRLKQAENKPAQMPTIKPITTELAHIGSEDVPIP